MATKGEMVDRMERLLRRQLRESMAHMLEIAVFHDHTCVMHQMVTEHLSILGVSVEDLIAMVGEPRG